MLWKLSNHLDFKATILINITKNEEIINVDELEELKIDLFDMISTSIDMISTSNIDKTLDMINLADVYLQYETDEMKKEFKKDWESRGLPFPDKTK